MEFNLVALRAVVGEKRFLDLINDEEYLLKLCGRVPYGEWLDVDTKLGNSSRIQNVYGLDVMQCTHPNLKISTSILIDSGNLVLDNTVEFEDTDDDFDIFSDTLKIDDSEPKYNIHGNPDILLHSNDDFILNYIYQSVDLSDRNLDKIPKIFKTSKAKKVFDISFNLLRDLENSPRESGSFICSNNSLITLKGAPNIVNRSFSCNRNQLTTLEYAPLIVGGDFRCQDNNIISLKGCPEKISGAFDCRNNKLTSLKYAPKTVNGDFYCMGNSRNFTEQEVRAVCDVGGDVVC